MLSVFRTSSISSSVNKMISVLRLRIMLFRVLNKERTLSVKDSSWPLVWEIFNNTNSLYKFTVFFRFSL